MTTAITAPEQLSLQDTLTLSEVFVKSGYFKDARDQAQGVVKILAGREMGFGPVASMGGINIIQGKPSTGANLLAAAIKRAPQYNYRPVVMENERAELVFFENGEEVGRSVFTIEDAKKAGLVTKENWKKYPRNMLFSRALSNGARWYCPDVYSGVTPYTPEELGADIDADTGEIIDTKLANGAQEGNGPDRGSVPEAPLDDSPGNTEPAPEPDPPPTSTNGNGRPLTGPVIRDTIRTKAGWEDGSRLDSEPVTEKQVGLLAGLTSKATVKDGMSQAEISKSRHDLLQYLVGVRSTKQLTKREAGAMIDWLISPNNINDINAYAQAEAANILQAAAVEAGQMEMEIP